jgi:DNA repair exonuclease SbcCD nuclease subunit
VGKILCLSDVHATARPPSSCTDAYWPDILSLLWQTVEIARLTDVSAVVWAGDILHHKAPSRTDHAVVMELIRVIAGYQRPLLITPGNHDMRHDRIDSIDATQPLGVLYQAGAQRLEGWADGNLPLYGVPWQQEWREAGIAAALGDFRERVFSRTLVVAHAPIYPPDRVPRHEGAEVTPAAWWSLAMEDVHPDMTHGLFYGHIHEPHGTWVQDGVRFCNNGALSRGSLDEYNLHREVGCTLWDDGTGEFEFVPLKALPAEELFRLRERDRAVTAQAVLGDFLADVGTARFGVLSIEGVLARIEQTPGVGRDVAELAAELLAEAAHGGKR